MAIPKSLKAKNGRIGRVSHLDLIEVEWIDTTSSAHWINPNQYEPLSKCVSVGYFDCVVKCKKTGVDTLSLYGDYSDQPKLIARMHSIPLKNVIEVRVVSKGAAPNGSKKA